MLLLWLLRSVEAADVYGRGRAKMHMTFVNRYDAAREIYWISESGEFNRMGSVDGGYGEFHVNTFEGHEFGWRLEEDTEECGEELDGRVQMRRDVVRYVLGDEFPVNVAEIADEFSCQFVNKSPYAMRINGTIVHPQESTTLSVRRGEFYDWTTLEGGELLYRSVIERFGQSPQIFREEKHTMLCSDKTPKSPTVRETQYDDHIKMEVLREDPLIAILKNWTTAEECASLETEAHRAGLTGAQVFGENAIVADRRAQSANVYWDVHNDTSVSNSLIRRAFELARKLKGYDVLPGPAQEPLNFIEYGYADEYRPHCDGVCHRAKYARGGRVATLIHYCKAPSQGGATVFPKIQTKVVADDNDALLFTYKGDDGYMDDGHTLHTGCLVKQGPKKIVTMWMRENVHDGEPWSNFLS